jgi:hypothetical protein
MEFLLLQERFCTPADCLSSQHSSSHTNYADPGCSAHLLGKCVVVLQIHDANLVFGLEDNTSIREKKDGHELFRHCRQASSATERVQNDLKLGASHQAVLACLRGETALAGCSIAPEVLLPILS